MHGWRFPKKGGDQLARISRVKGFVLLESIFAMITIMICFGISMMIFNMITSGGTGTRLVNARIRLQSEADACKHEKRFTDEVTTAEGYTIEKSFGVVKDHPEITHMKIIARDAEGIIFAEYNELLLLP
jgi:predicted NBD/HSP70 family sugar kinase